MRILILLLLTTTAYAQDVVLSDFQTKIGNCIYEIGQKSQEEADWVCVTFSPTSVGDHPWLWDAAVGCQLARGADKHALWGNHIVLWPVSCDTPPTELAWAAPTQNEDGSPLTDLAGYNVYCADQTWELGPLTTSWQFDPALSGEFTCHVTAFDEVPNESANSGTVTVSLP